MPLGWRAWRVSVWGSIDMHDMAPTGCTLADLNLAGLEAAILAAQVDSMRTHAVAAALSIAIRMDGGRMLLELTATTVVSRVTRTIGNDEVWFADLWQVDRFLKDALAGVCASAVAEMDLAAEGIGRQG